MSANVRIFSSIAVCVLLSGCSSAVQPSTEAISQRTPTGLASTDTPTLQASQTLPSSLSPEPTITWTPIPTLPGDKSAGIILAYYQNNGGCQVPCWWGIVPSQTTWPEVHAKLSPLGEESGPYMKSGLPRYDYAISVPKDIYPAFPYFEPSIWLENDLVSVISLNTAWVQRDFDTSLAGLLNAFGEPGEVWISINMDTAYQPRYELALLFPLKGVLLSVSGDTVSQGDRLAVCPRAFRYGNFPPGIMLFSPLQKDSFEELAEKTGRIDAAKFQRLGDISNGYDAADFYEDYLNPANSACISIDPTKVH